MTNKKVLDAVQIIVDFCKEQRGCQNCIFRKFGSDHWNCYIDAFDLRDVLSNIESKKINRGYL